MEEQRQGESNIKKHLASLHKRIQTKYIEMQRKIEKSKSVDCISNLSDDFSHTDLAYGSLNDLRDDEVFISDKEKELHSFVEEEVPNQRAITHEVEFVEASFAHAECDRNSSGDWEKVDAEPLDIRTNVSTESLNEGGKDSDDSLRLTPPPKTIRQRFIAARERRREERERQAQLKKEKMDLLVLSNIKQDGTARVRKKLKSATVTVALIEVTDLETLSDGKERLLNCRYRLGSEKGKSKVVKSSSSGAKWQELFNINMFDEHLLELSCFDKQVLLGRHVIDLTELENEKTHQLKLDLKDGEATGAHVFVLLTISGVESMNSVSDSEDLKRAQNQLISYKGSGFLGMLSVIVHGAKGLAAQDCYCVLNLVNERLQTHTEHKTQEPNWMKLFTFNVGDITTTLDVTIIEEKKSEEVGKISIPLLKIHNGEKVWYALKDSTQRERAKGNNPRILLEMRISWNILKASLRVVNPKEVIYLRTSPKLDRRVFARNLSRARAIIKWILDVYRTFKTCFEWESTKSNAVALTLFILFCYFFKVWMLPLLLFIPFIRYRPGLRFSYWKKPSENAVVKREKEERSTLRQKINSLAEMVQTVQNVIGQLAGFGESVKNLFNFTVPFVSLFATFLILLITVIMYIIPLKYIFILWGIHKFTRKILRPNRIPNNELLDLLSRVPDDETLLDWEELPLELDSEEENIQKQ